MNMLQIAKSHLANKQAVRPNEEMFAAHSRWKKDNSLDVGNTMTMPKKKEESGTKGHPVVGNEKRTCN